jgi:hypothetical protein
LRPRLDYSSVHGVTANGHVLAAEGGRALLALPARFFIVRRRFRGAALTALASTECRPVTTRRQPIILLWRRLAARAFAITASIGTRRAAAQPSRDASEARMCVKYF